MWLKQFRYANIIIEGLFLKLKTDNFAKTLGYEQFRASNEWFKNFKKWHDISLKKVYNKSAAVNDTL